jgi:hypothetical protein
LCNCGKKVKSAGQQSHQSYHDYHPYDSLNFKTKTNILHPIEHKQLFILVNEEKAEKINLLESHGYRPDGRLHHTSKG